MEICLNGLVEETKRIGTTVSRLNMMLYWDIRRKDCQLAEVLDWCGMLHRHGFVGINIWVLPRRSRFAGEGGGVKAAVERWRESDL